MSYYGDIKPGVNVDMKFCTVNTTGAPAGLVSGAVSIYKDNSVTQFTTGVTLSTAFDSVVGLNHVRIVTTNTTNYPVAGGNEYHAVITTGTVAGVSVVGYVIGAFSTRNRALGSNAILSTTLNTAAITSAKFASAAITSTVLNTAAITAAKFASGAITSTVINTNAIGSAELADGAIDAATFASGAITSTVLNTAAITSAKFATGAITSTVIQSNAIGANEIASGAITSAKFASAAITATVLNTGAITSAKFASAAITATVLNTGAITSAKFASAAITATVLNTAAITAAKFGSAAITSTVLGAGAAQEIADQVWEEAIADHSGTSGSTAEALAAAQSAGDPWNTALPGGYASGKAGFIVGTFLNTNVGSRATQASVDTIDTNVDSILDDTGTSGVKIGASALTATAINTGALTSAKFASGAITSTVLNTAAITSAKFASAAITATVLNTGAITSAKFASGAITSTVIQSNAIGANELASGAITSAKFASSAITATVLSTTAGTKIHTSINAGTVGVSVASILDDTGTAGVAIADGAIATTKFAAGAIDAAAIAADAIGSSELAATAATEIADAVLDRDMSTGTDSGSTTVRTPRQALYALRNKVSISGTTLTVTKTDDSTASWTATVTTTAGNPLSAIDPAGP